MTDPLLGQKVIMAIVLSLKDDDYAFTIFSKDTAWDVYRFTQPKHGAIAVAIIRGKAHVGTILGGIPDEATMQRALDADLMTGDDPIHPDVVSLFRGKT